MCVNIRMQSRMLLIKLPNRLPKTDNNENLCRKLENVLKNYAVPV